MYANHYYPGYAYYPQSFFVSQNPMDTYEVFSSPNPVCKQKNRSSNNFLVPTGNYTIKAPSGITFGIYEDKAGKDPHVGDYKNQGAASSKYTYPVPLTAGKNYYIVTKGAKSGFPIQFSATT